MKQASSREVKRGLWMKP